MSWKRKEVIGDAVLYLADSTQLIDQLEGVDAVVTDPPYGISYVRSAGGRGLHSARSANKHHPFANVPIVGDDEPFDPAIWCRWPCILFGADHYAARLPMDGVFHVWDKDPRGRLEWDSFSDAEIAWTNWRTRRRVFRFLWKGLCQEGAGTKRLHPTMKPVEVMVWCIQMLKPNCRTILDPYMGSGSTGLACVQLGKRFIGIEIDDRYFDVACERVAVAQAQGRLFA